MGRDELRKVDTIWKEETRDEKTAGENWWKELRSAEKRRQNRRWDELKKIRGGINMCENRRWDRMRLDVGGQKIVLATHGALAHILWAHFVFLLYGLSFLKLPPPACPGTTFDDCTPLESIHQLPRQVSWRRLSCWQRRHVRSCKACARNSALSAQPPRPGNSSGCHVGLAGKVPMRWNKWWPLTFGWRFLDEDPQSESRIWMDLGIVG